MPYYSLANLILIAALHVGVAQPLSYTVITAQSQSTRNDNLQCLQCLAIDFDENAEVFS